MEKRRGRDGTNLIVPVPKKNNNTSQKLKVLLRGALLITQITKNSHKKIPRTLRGYDRLAISPDSPTDSPIYITRQMESI